MGRRSSLYYKAQVQAESCLSKVQDRFSSDLKIKFLVCPSTFVFHYVCFGIGRIIELFLPFYFFCWSVCDIVLGTSFISPVPANKKLSKVKPRRQNINYIAEMIFYWKCITFIFRHFSLFRLLAVASCLCAALFAIPRYSGSRITIAGTQFLLLTENLFHHLCQDTPWQSQSPTTQ